MDETEIKYEFNPDHFKELVWSNATKSILTYKPTQIAIILTLLFLVASALSYYVALDNAEIGFIVFVCALFAAISLIVFVYYLAVYFILRRRLNNYLRFMAGKKQIISIKGDIIKIEIDDQIIEEYLEDFRPIVVRDDCITVNNKAGVGYFFVAKSMDAESYNKLKMIVENKLA